MIDHLNPLSVIPAMAILGVLTYAYRFSFISEKGSEWTSKVPERFLELLGPAAFTAIIFNNLIAQSKTPDFYPAKLTAAVLAVIVAYYSRSVVLTIVFGLGLLQIWPS